MIKLKNKYIYLAIIFIALIAIALNLKNIDNKISKKGNIIMGGREVIISCEYDKEDIEVEDIDYSKDYDRFFRPSKLPILNTNTISFDYNKDNPEDINIPKELLKTPEDTIINYFSTLMEAANPTSTSEPYTGCGTLGEAKEPYPYAYNYFTKSYKEKHSYKNYLKSFEDILHINLIKLEQVPSDYKHSKDLKYFIELETIQGSPKGIGLFAYYYGYVYLSEEDGVYKISDIEYSGENYLCAPYHSWKWDAELSTDIRYGEWCNLIKEKHPIEVDGYKKKVKFLGTDGNEYMILYYQLTNGYDIEIAQLKMGEDGKWININLDPTKCLKDHANR